MSGRRSGSAHIRKRWSRTRQVNTTEDRHETGIGRERSWIQHGIGRKRCTALRRIIEPGISDKYRNTIRVEARRVESGIDDSEVIIFREEGVLIDDARLHVVNALHVGKTRSGARVSERPILSNALRLNIRAEIRERVGAWVVVITVVSNEEAEGEHGGRTDQVIPRRREVKRLNLRALVRGTDNVTVGIETAVVDHHSSPRRAKLSIE